MKNNNQKGSQKAYFGLIIGLVLVVFVFLAVVKNVVLVGFEEQVLPDKELIDSLDDSSFVVVDFSGYKVKAEVAKSDSKKNKGLSGRKELKENTGMLFVFDRPGVYIFWNKDTNIPLDVLWIKNNKVVDIQYLPAFDEKKGIVKLYPSGNKVADMVLEIPGEEAQKNGIKIGTKLKITKYEN